MKTLQINTTQNVAINFDLANIGQRLLAFIIDNIIKFAYYFTVIKVVNFESIMAAFEGDSWSQRSIFILIFLPVTLYTLVLEILMNGQTIGKRVLKLKVINIDGFKPTISDYVMRWFMRIIDFNFFFIALVYIYVLELDEYYYLVIITFVLGKLIGFIAILITNNNQRLGDITANTIVISLKDTALFSDTILENIKETYQPTYPNVIKLTDNDMRIIKETFKTAAKNDDFKTLIKLRSKIIEVTGIESVHKTDKEFIDIILKDYNYYTQDM